MKKPIISLLALLVSASVFSQALPAPIPRVVFPTTVVGNVVTYGPLTADASNAAKFSFGAAANGAVFANTGTALATAGGGSVNLGVSSTVSKLAAARAVGRFAMKTVPFLTVGSAILDLARELGFGVNTTPTGTTVTKTQAGAGVYYNVNWGQDYKFASRQEVCTAYARNVGQPALYAIGTSNSCYYDAAGTQSAGSVIGQLSQGADTTVPVVQQDYEDAINNRSAWTPDSKLGPSVSDALKSGEQLEAVPTIVSGPATSPGTSSQTNTANDPATNSSANPANNSNTSTTTLTQTNNHTYNGPSVSTTTTTTSTTVNNSTGAVTNNTTTTTAPVAPVPPADIVTCGLPGKPACVIDEAGMPTKADVDAVMKKTPTEIQKDVDDIAKNPKSFFPAFPTLNWAFALPSGCAQISTPAFAPFMSSIDVCQFQPIFHDVMSVVWMLGGLFGAISLFMKNALSS